MPLHFPGYNWLGPGTDIVKAAAPVNSLDNKARLHDLHYDSYTKQGNNQYYWRDSRADRNFLRRIKNERSPEAWIAWWLFNQKRIFTLPLDTVEQQLGKRKKMSLEDYGFRPVKRTRPVRRERSKTPVLMISDRPWKQVHNNNLANNNNMARFRRNARRHIRRIRKKFRKGRGKKETLFKKVMSIINPTRTLMSRKIDRAFGTMNAADYISLGYHVDNFSGNYAEYCPGSFGVITEGLTNTQVKSGANSIINWHASERYYWKEKHLWRISNNSNVTMKFSVYYIKHKGSTDKSIQQTLLDNTAWDALGSTEYYSSTGLTPSTRNTHASKDFSSEPQYNAFTDRYLKTQMQERFSIKKGKSMILNPGQTTSVTYNKRKLRKCDMNTLWHENDLAYTYPRGAVEVYIRYEGDILPGPDDQKSPDTADTYAGINRGDVTIDHRFTVTCMQKLNPYSTKYIVNTGENESDGPLKVFGFDNNAAAVAI